MNTTPNAPTDDEIMEVGFRHFRPNPEMTPKTRGAFISAVREILSLHPAPSAELVAPVASPESMADARAFLDLAAHYCSTASNGDWTFAQGDIENFAAEVVAKHHAGRSKAVRAAIAVPIAPSPPTTPPAAEPGAWLVTGTYLHQPFSAKSSAEAYVKGLLTTDPEGGYKITPLYAAPSTTQGLSDAEIVKIVNQSDLRDMHEHMGWYSAPEKAFRQHALALARQIEAAILAAAKETK